MDEVPVCVLTLDGSTRVDKLVSELERVELLPVCKFVKNKRDTEDGVRGCFLAHQGALSEALESFSNARAIVVLEDDVCFDLRRGQGRVGGQKGGWEFVQEAIEEAVKAVEKGEVDCVGLGGLPLFPYKRRVRGCKNVFRTSFQCAHAYVISQEGARKMLQVDFERHEKILRIGDHWDQTMSARLEQAMVYPSVAFQSASPEISTVSGTTFYRTVTFLRDIVTERRVQILLEIFAFGTGVLLRVCFSCFMGSAKEKESVQKRRRHKTVLFAPLEME